MSRAHHACKSSKPSSLRTQVSSVAHLSHVANLSAVASRHMRHQSNVKASKTSAILIPMKLPLHLHHVCWPADMIDQNTLVVDGGAPGNPPIHRPPDFSAKNPPWKCISVSNGDLCVADTKNPTRGPTMSVTLREVCPLVRAPRQVAPEMTGPDNSSICSNCCAALCCACKAQKCTQKRSVKKHIF